MPVTVVHTVFLLRFGPPKADLFEDKLDSVRLDCDTAPTAEVMLIYAPRIQRKVTRYPGCMQMSFSDIDSQMYSLEAKGNRLPDWLGQSLMAYVFGIAGKERECFKLRGGQIGGVYSAK